MRHAPHHRGHDHTCKACRASVLRHFPWRVIRKTLLVRQHIVEEPSPGLLREVPCTDLAQHGHNLPTHLHILHSRSHWEGLKRGSHRTMSNRGRESLFPRLAEFIHPLGHIPCGFQQHVRAQADSHGPCNVHPWNCSRQNPRRTAGNTLQRIPHKAGCYRVIFLNILDNLSSHLPITGKGSQAGLRFRIILIKRIPPDEILNHVHSHRCPDRHLIQRAGWNSTFRDGPCHVGVLQQTPHMIQEALALVLRFRLLKGINPRGDILRGGGLGKGTFARFIRQRGFRPFRLKRIFTRFEVGHYLIPFFPLKMYGVPGARAFHSSSVEMVTGWADFTPGEAGFGAAAGLPPTSSSVIRIAFS